MMKKSKKAAMMSAKKRGIKACSYCKDSLNPNWQEYEKLKEFLSPRGRILSSQLTGICVRHQRKLSRAIKEARHLALLPFVTQE